MKKLLILFILIATPLLASASVLQDPSYFPLEDQLNQDADYFDVNPHDNEAERSKWELLYGNSCIADGSCSLDQGFHTFVVIVKLALGILGSVSLLFFIIGGFMWMTAAGHSDKISKGKSIMVNTLIGIIIVLSAWMIVQTVLTSISDKTLTGIDDSSQIIDSCSTLPDGTSCKGNLGKCKSNVCTQKCDTEPTGDGYDCRQYNNCNIESIIPYYCFGANDILCCKQKQ
jgi:Type IV secretion system pilin